MSIIITNIRELEETGCFTDKELEDLRERFQKVYEEGFWDGREFTNNEKIVSTYGKKEDW